MRPDVNGYIRANARTAENSGGGKHGPRQGWKGYRGWTAGTMGPRGSMYESQRTTCSMQHTTQRAMCSMRQTARVAQVDYKDDGPQKFTVVVGPCESADRRFNFEKWGGPIASGVMPQKHRVP
jgi:hypothetical protein